MPSVAEAAKLATGHTIPPVEPLKQLLGFEHLSKTLRHILHAKVDAAERAAAASEGRWPGWRSFVIDRIVIEAPEIRSFYLRPRDDARLCQPRPGQFVSVQMRDAGGETITRCWSLSLHAREPEYYRLTVRRQNGRGSNWLHAASVGATVRLRAPAGEFTLDLGGFRPLVLVAAGIGITPLLAMLHAQLARRLPGTPVYLIYGARTPAEMAFRAELDALAAANPNLQITYVYSRSESGSRPPTRITPDLLLSVLTNNHVMLSERRIALPWHESDTYICGPGDFCARLKNELVIRGANADHIFFESFSAPPAIATDVQSAQVRFRRSGITCTWRADEDLSLLELAEQAGISVPSDCRAGACLSCKTAVIAGAATTDMGDGTALLCIGRPRSASLTLDC
jgi:ferredoxin-NADP reductase